MLGTDVRCRAVTRIVIRTCGGMIQIVNQWSAELSEGDCMGSTGCFEIHAPETNLPSYLIFFSFFAFSPLVFERQNCRVKIVPRKPKLQAVALLVEVYFLFCSFWSSK